MGSGMISKSNPGWAIPSERPRPRYIGGPINPTLIQDNVWWLRSDLGISATDGQTVGTWVDQSGSNDTNKNASGIVPPTYTISDVAYGGHPSLTFVKASSNYMKTGIWASALPQPYTIMVVGNVDGTVANEYMLDGLTTDSGNLLGSWTVGNSALMYAGNTLGGGVITASPQILIAVYNGASSRLYQSAKTPVASGDAGTNGRTGAYIAIAGGAAGNPMGGKLVEVAAWSRALSDAEIAIMLQADGQRYGISIGA